MSTLYIMKLGLIEGAHTYISFTIETLRSCINKNIRLYHNDIDFYSSSSLIPLSKYNRLTRELSDIWVSRKGVSASGQSTPSPKCPAPSPVDLLN